MADADMVYMQEHDNNNVNNIEVLDNISFITVNLLEED